MEIEDLRLRKELKARLSDRITLIERSLTLVMDSDAWLALHVLPLSNLLDGDFIDVEDLLEYREQLDFGIDSDQQTGFSVDGVFTSLAGETEGAVSAYALAFRRGGVEMVQSSRRIAAYPGEGDEKLIRIAGLENRLMNSIKSFLRLIQNTQRPYPVLVQSSMRGMEDFELLLPEYLRSSFVRPSEKTMKRPLSWLPSIWLDEKTDDKELEQVLKPMFDAFWNTFGYPRSMSYNKEGWWDPVRIAR